MNNKTIIIVVVILLAGGYFWFWNKGEKNETPQVEEKSPSEINRENIIKNYIEKYQADSEIKENMVYSYQLEDALVKSMKPFIFSASLDDVFRKDGTLYAKLSPSLFDFDTPKIFYTLSGCEEKIMQLAGSEKNAVEKLWGEYLVVAKISSISKPTIKIDASAIDDEDVEIELSQPNTFMATGECLDITYLESDDIF